MFSQIIKKTILLGMVFFLVSKQNFVLSQASWKEQNIQAVNDLSFKNLNTVFFSSPQHGWIGGWLGYILATKDGGETWALKQTKVSAAIYSIYFVNENVGWAVGGGGLIIKTTDGGETWQKYTYPNQTAITRDLRTVYFTSPTDGWIGGEFLGLLKTTDAGLTWQKIELGNNLDAVSTRIYTVQFVSPKVGWASGSTASGPYNLVLKTTDGGLTWNIQSSSLPLVSATVFSQSFISEQKGWIMHTGAARVFYTNDGGNTWAQQHNTNQATVHTSTIAFANEMEGWVGGSPELRLGSGYLIKTSDGGKTWQNETFIPNKIITKIFMLSDTLGWAVGTAGLVMKYSCDAKPKVSSENPESICNHESTLLKAQADVGSVNWYTTANGNTKVFTGTEYQTPNLTTNSSYWVEASSKCGTSDREKIDVVVKKVNKEVTNQSNVLTATESNATYQWYDCGKESDISEATQQSFKPVSSGSYAVNITKDGCSERSGCIDVKLPITQLASSQIEAMSIFPNPTSEKVKVIVPNLTNIDYTITNALGDILQSGNLNSNNDLNLVDFPQGIYYLNIKQLNKIVKIIKN